MATKWTEEQLQAIEIRDSNILVAAAARQWKNCGVSGAHNKKDYR